MMAGRVNTTLTLIIFLLIFGFQIGVGAVLSLWQATAGRYPHAARFSAWSILVALRVGSAIWYALLGRVLAKPAHLQAERQS